MIAYDEALGLLLHRIGRRDGECVPSRQAQSRILAEDLRSPVDLPRFDSAAMDGYALNAQGTRLRPGSEWTVEACAAAGETSTYRGDGALEIMTGAALPAGLDTVVPVERTQALPVAAGQDLARIRIAEEVLPAQNIRCRGEDVAVGDLVMAGGEQLQPAHIMLFAALGIGSVPVVRRPRVALIATGRELAGPDAPLQEACIHDSNLPFLQGRLPLAGAEVVSVATVADDPMMFRAELDRALELGVDLIVSTGAVSKGRHDFVPAAVQAHGAEILFHGVGIRPGKPLLHSRLRDGTPHLGLPGNPLSCAVGLRFFVEPLLRAMLGLPRERPRRLPLAAPCRKKLGLRGHFHAKLVCDDGGCLRAQLSPRQQSFRLLPYLAAHAWVVLPEAVDDMQAGEFAEVYGLGHLQPPAWSMAAWE